MDSLTTYMSIVAALGLLIAFMAHRQSLQEEADEAERASGTAAE